jgi:mannosyltransferase OCH1-like enzyme
VLAEQSSRAILSKHKPLPKIIHQQWKTADIPDKFHHKEFKRLFPAPEFTQMIWTDETMRQLIKEDFPWFLESYDSYPRGIQRADAARYFILYRYGGLYADMDYQPLENFWQYLPEDRPALVESPYTFDSILQNSLMSSPPQHPFWNATFDLMMSRASPDNHYVLESTGPIMLQEVYLEDMQSLLPCENFQRVPYSKDTLWITNWFRWFMSWTWMMKPCGDVNDQRCQLGIHHSVVGWTIV